MKRPHIEHVDSRLPGKVVSGRAPNRSAYAYLEDMAPLDQSLFDRPSNGGAVVVLLSPSFVGCVRMRVELDEGEPGMFSARRAEDGQEDGMIAA